MAKGADRKANNIDDIRRERPGLERSGRSVGRLTSSPPRYASFLTGRPRTYRSLAFPGGSNSVNPEVFVG